MIRFGLVGCGKIAERHAKILGGGFVEDATLQAVCDTDRLRADNLAAQYKAKAFYNVGDLGRANDIDVFTVLTPSGLHAKNVVDLAPSGRPIVVEKPMALTLDDADRMIDACDRNRAKLFVVKQNRFNKPVQALRKALDAGRFGKLVLGTVRVRWCRRQDYYDQASWRGTWAFDGGVLANQASHHIDLLEWMMGPVDSVFGLAK